MQKAQVPSVISGQSIVGIRSRRDSVKKPGPEEPMGRKPSDDYSPGEPGMWGEPYEMIDEIEGDEDDEDD